MDSNYVKLNYSSTLDGSVLILTCENYISNMNTTDEQVLNVICHSNESWIPDPADFIKSCSIILSGIFIYHTICIINHTLPSTIRVVTNTLTCTSMASNSISNCMTDRLQVLLGCMNTCK